jgi:hypothetical protein
VSTDSSVGGGRCGSTAGRVPGVILESQKLRCYTWRMTPYDPSLKALSDRDLLTTVSALAAQERGATANLIAALAEVDARRLYLGEGCSSLFTYCTQVLHLSEHAAYGRIEAARAARRFPIILELLAEGSITLTTVTLLAPHLTVDNCRQLLEDARHKSRREIEHMVAALRPQPSVATSIRKLPTKAPEPRPTECCASPIERDLLASQASSPVPPPKRPAALVPLAPERYRVQFTVSRAVHDKLRVAQDLLRHSIPDGDPAAIFERALTLLLSELEKKKCAAASRPRSGVPARPGSRRIPAAVRREVWARDGGRCAFAGSHGRCTERGFLEFHHVTPYAVGGTAVSTNIQLRCRRHNAYEADVYFGAMGGRASQKDSHE